MLTSFIVCHFYFRPRTRYQGGVMSWFDALKRHFRTMKYVMKFGLVMYHIRSRARPVPYKYRIQCWLQWTRENYPSLRA